MGGSEMKELSEKLRQWQKRLADANAAQAAEVRQMDERERLYAGDHKLRPLVEGDHNKDGDWKKTSHVRNIVFENIESQISTTIPMPKVTPRRKKDEHLARLIEHFLRNELDRLPFEKLNDMAERTVPIQGGCGFLVEWDDSAKTQFTNGELAVSLIHPKQLGPQPAVYTSVEAMDWVIVKLPTTKAAVWRKYGKRVDDEYESEGEIRSVDGEQLSEDAVTEYIGFEKTDEGVINRFAWVNDVELEDLKNYQARHQQVCAKCGKPRPMPGQLIYRSHAAATPGNLLPDLQTGTVPGDLLARLGGAESVPMIEGAETLPMNAGTETAQMQQTEPQEPEKYGGGACPWCDGEKWTSAESEFEQIMEPMQTNGGVIIPGPRTVFNENGETVIEAEKIPFYKPNVYPIVLQKSVSIYGKILGNSDVDVMQDQQNTTNRMSQKIIDRLVKAGTRITLPDRADFRVDPEDGERWYIGNPQDKNLIGVYDFSGNLQFEMAYLSEVYEEARQQIGITKSFQGREDSTAVSGKAKQFAAAQSAGRLESKRVMKNAAYAELFELMFKFALAYADEPREIHYEGQNGATVYEEFNRYDFLEKRKDGSWYWNDDFLFSVDTSALNENNREAMWEQCRNNLMAGAYGDPKATKTLIRYWTMLEQLHYPRATETLNLLKEQEKEEQQAAQMQAMMLQQAAAQGNPAMTPSVPQQMPRGAGDVPQQF